MSGGSYWRRGAARMAQWPQGKLSRKQILGLPSTPAGCPAYFRGPYRFTNREYFILPYETDEAALRRIVPEPLVPTSNIALYEWIAMPDSTGFGDYMESGIVIPCVYPETGEEINFTAAMLLDCEPPTSAGREIWGFPKRLAKPSLSVRNDVLVGKLDYQGVRVAEGSMAYKSQPMSEEAALKALSKKQCNLKLIPGLDGKPAIARLVSYKLQDVNFKGAWTGAARLAVYPHSTAAMCDLPVRKCTEAKHLLADITLPYGEILHDYLTDGVENAPDWVRLSPTMPRWNPTYLAQPTRLTDREYVILRYRTDLDVLKQHVPEELQINPDGEVVLQFIRTTGTGIGNYMKCDLLTPVQDATGRRFMFGLQSYADSSAVITYGREFLGEPYKFAQPSIEISHDTVNATLSYAGSTVATMTLPYKSHPGDEDLVRDLLSTPAVNLKMIPNVRGEPEICQLAVTGHHAVRVQECWRSSGKVQLFPHVRATLADFQPTEILEALLCRVELTVAPEPEPIVNYLSKK